MENYALVQRPAAFSWEASTLLTAAVQATPAVKISFPRPVIIVSAYPSIAVAGGDDALPMPTLDDLLIRIDVDTGNERRLTSRFDANQPNGIGNFPDVTFGSYKDTTGGARTMNLRLGDAGGGRPELQITWTWKRAIAGGPWFQDIFPAMTFHCEFVG